jgi:hypothetical protein
MLRAAMTSGMRRAMSALRYLALMSRCELERALAQARVRDDGS